MHTDHLNRPIMMTDGSKTKVWEAVWWPYAEAYTLTGAASLDLRFPGQWFQAESGLHYNWHRQYDPKLGRYLQPDPLGMPDGPNRWWYAKNNPLMEVDPEGTFVFPLVIGAGELFGPAITILIGPRIAMMMGGGPSRPNAGNDGQSNDDDDDDDDDICKPGNCRRLSDF